MKKKIKLDKKVKTLLEKKNAKVKNILQIIGILILSIVIIVCLLVVVEENNQWDKNKHSYQITETKQTDLYSDGRDKIIIYTVQKNDTLASLAEKFAISKQTIARANNLISDSLTIGQKLQILPVTGILYKVMKGDTVYSVAKNYHVNPQDIADVPFNSFANPQTLELIVGSTIIIPRKP